MWSFAVRKCTFLHLNVKQACTQITIANTKFTSVICTQLKLNYLNGRSPRSNNSHSFALGFIILLPQRGVERVALERVHAGELRQLGHVERPGAGHDDVGAQLQPRLGLHEPGVGLRVPRVARDPLPEPDVGGHAEPGRYIT